jgi:thymidylate synthase
MIKAVMEEGVELPSRVSPCREVHPVMVEVLNPRRRLVTAYERPVNVAFALAEVLWILQGRQDVKMLEFYNGSIANYSDDGTTFNAAYGHRLRHAFGTDQLLQVERLLREDGPTRQATLVMSHPMLDRAYDHGQRQNSPQHKTKDRACNVLAHLMIRDGALDWLQVVRSNDSMWGTPYNWMQFSHLQEYLAVRLGVPVGKYTHVVDSLHVYDYHYEAARNIRGFNLYDTLGLQHMLMRADDRVMNEVYAAETRIRQGEAERIPTLDIGLYWHAVLGVLTAHAAYKEGRDADALHILLNTDEVYAAAQARFYYYNRWHKPEYKSLVEDFDGAFGATVASWVTSAQKED